MSTDTFKASVQYNDLTGSAAADRADMSDASVWLKKHGLINDNELLVGYEIYVGQLSTGPTDKVSISTTFLLAQTSAMDSFSSSVKGGGSINLRKVTQDLSPEELFSLFKRFNVTLSSGGLLEGREYKYTERDA
ncbi:hypothetical protein EIM48_10030 [Pseudoxanthomonas sp. SGNA-20]|jgi:hypothetical protein|uniref:hypothetical protein n=1 Tax=Pseudoxanthomonas sp. SGNA-20 TaxID=2493088 RepID=UPI000F62D942|nr:hypothetical protein [Pseudoxanthomonas sp. SGNA-20]RRN55986.1 hypothetical protein EIM48_10030 [Pseudoxanthomonas sp. SGNA-20]